VKTAVDRAEVGGFFRTRCAGRAGGPAVKALRGRRSSVEGLARLLSWALGGPAKPFTVPFVQPARGRGRLVGRLYVISGAVVPFLGRTWAS